MIGNAGGARRMLGSCIALLLALGTLGALGTLSGAATAANPTGHRGGQPPVIVKARVTRALVRIHVRAPYAKGEIRRATCRRDTRRISCGRPHAAGKHHTTYQRTLRGLRSGRHVFRISVRVLARHRPAKAKVVFRISGAPTPRSVCLSLKGTFSGTGFFGWSCAGTFDDPGLGKLIDVCDGTFLPDTNSCSVTANVDSGHVTCINITPASVFTVLGDLWTCSTDGVGANIPDDLGTWCSADGGTLTNADDPERAGFQLYACTAGT